jgi:hypothetical protein
MKEKIAALMGFAAGNIKESLKLRMIFLPFHMTRSITLHYGYPWLI